MQRTGMAVSTTLALLLAAPDASPAPVTIRDGATDIVVDPASQDGLRDWTLGVDHAVKQWFWYRKGASVPETSIDALVLESALATDTDGDAEPDTLVTIYQDPEGDFRLEVSWRVSGQNPRPPNESLEATLAVQVLVENLRTNVLPFTLFQYVDMDLGGGSQDTFIAIDCGDTGLDRCDIGNLVSQQEAGPLLDREEPATGHLTGIVPRAVDPDDFFLNPIEIRPFPVLLDSLNDAAPTTLSGGPLPNRGHTGNHTWAISWTADLLPGRQALALAQAQQLRLSAPAAIVPLPFLDPFLDLVENQALFGTGSQASAARRLADFADILERSDSHLQVGRIDAACAQLLQAQVRSDGDPTPADWVQGPGLPELSAIIANGQAQLSCRQQPLETGDGGIKN